MRTILSGLAIALQNQLVHKQALVMADQRIDAIISEQMIEHHLPAQHYHFPNNYTLTPGLIDLHIHGANGFDMMDGTFEAIDKISLALAREGVTGFLATTMSADTDHLEKALTNLSNYSNEQGAKLLGIHLEGPFIASKKAGAQLAETLCDPNINLFNKWQRIAKQKIKLVTLAPELPNAIDLIQVLKKQSVIAAIGHTHATYAETQKAIAAGCTYATHLFNAMRSMHQREPGATGALLLADEVSVEIIADGIHVHPGMIQLMRKLKHDQQIILVTDAMRAKCLGDGRYELGGQMVDVKDTRASLIDGTLAGSVLRLPEAMLNMMNFTECTITEVINMASLNPARILKIDQHKGSISVGKDADLVVFNDTWNPALTYRNGKLIYKNSEVESFLVA